MADSEPLSTRAPRMKTYQRLIADLDSGGGRNSRALSEVDLSDPEDVRAVVADAGGDVLVHLGNSNFLQRFQVYQSHVQEWRQQFQKLDSVDLRYDREVIVNPESSDLPRTTPLRAAAAVPAGWSASSARTGTVAPGATASAAVLVAPPSTAPAAFYSVTLSARNASATTYVASAAATVAVESTTSGSTTTTTTTTSGTPLSAAVRTSSSTYKRPSAGYVNASIVTTVTSAGAPVAGAIVRVETRDPYGRVTAASATTNSLGNATVYYTLKSDSAVGTYALAIKATTPTATATATGSFNVTKY
jgi:cell division protein FtsQ